MKTKEMLDCLIRNGDSGIIFIDKNGVIASINEKAKKIVGISIDNLYTHEAGRIEEGDIVIIADTQIGEDDGDLCPDDLELINIDNKKIKKDDIFIGVGTYKSEGSKPKYKFSSRSSLSTEFNLEETYRGHDIRAFIDFKKNIIGIEADGKAFTGGFISSYGHIVVIDGVTGKIKFYQDRGYSIRKEWIKSLLYGKEFETKGFHSGNDVVGKKFRDLFDDAEYLEKNLSISDDNDNYIKNVIYEVNKRPLLLSIYSVAGEKGELAGTLIKMSEIAELQEMLWERNQIITAMETKYKEFFLSKKDIPDDAFTEVVGNSGEMREVKQLAYKVALRNCNVIITGESGTGKSLLAKEIYKAGGSVGPFVSVDCSTISPNLFESEMFGYVGGAFTGANPKGKIGFFESANGGTIFLDEIGEIPLSIQVKLLNVLQNKEIYRVGDTKSIPVSVRIIAATNKNLEEEINKGNFRKDLFYRINVFSIELPPLRKCKDDIFFLTQNFLSKTCEEYGLESKMVSSEALMKILAYDWPGNIRELQNVIERAALFCDDYIIYSEHINIPADSSRRNLRDMMKNEQKKIITETIKSCGNDKKLAMEELGLSKSVFYAKLKEYDIKD